MYLFSDKDTWVVATCVLLCVRGLPHVHCRMLGITGFLNILKQSQICIADASSAVFILRPLPCRDVQQADTEAQHAVQLNPGLIGQALPASCRNVLFSQTFQGFHLSCWSLPAAGTVSELEPGQIAWAWLPCGLSQWLSYVVLLYIFFSRRQSLKVNDCIRSVLALMLYKKFGACCNMWLSGLRIKP